MAVQSNYILITHAIGRGRGNWGSIGKTNKSTLGNVKMKFPFIIPIRKLTRSSCKREQSDGFAMGRKHLASSAKRSMEDERTD